MDRRPGLPCRRIASRRTWSKGRLPNGSRQGLRPRNHPDQDLSDDDCQASWAAFARRPVAVRSVEDEGKEVPARASHLPTNSERNALQRLRASGEMTLKALGSTSHRTVLKMMAKGWKWDLQDYSRLRCCIASQNAPLGEAAERGSGLCQALTGFRALSPLSHLVSLPL